MKPIEKSSSHPETGHNASDEPVHAIRLQVTELINQQLTGVIDAISARASWYSIMDETDEKALADYITWALHCAIIRANHTMIVDGIEKHGIPNASPRHEERAEHYAEICRVIGGQIYGNRDLPRAHKFWAKALSNPHHDRSLLIDALLHVLTMTRDDLKQS